MMGLDNPLHIAFLLIVLLLVFGAKRLPELGHSLGTGLRGFKQAVGGEGLGGALSPPEERGATPEHVAASATPTAATPLVSVQDDRVA
jgi:sec-independent protein translocase protein TatA